MSAKAGSRARPSMPLWPWQNRSSAATAAPLAPNRWRTVPSGVRTDRPRHFSVKNRVPSGAKARSQGLSRLARMTVRWTRRSPGSAARAGAAKTRTAASSRIAASRNRAGVVVRCMVSSWVLGRATRPRVLRPRPSAMVPSYPIPGKLKERTSRQRAQHNGAQPRNAVLSASPAPIDRVHLAYYHPCRTGKEGKRERQHSPQEAANQDRSHCRRHHRIDV